MDRSRKGSPPSNVLAFRIPERTEAPKLPPANGGRVAAFKPKAVPVAPAAGLWTAALEEFLRAERS